MPRQTAALCTPDRSARLQRQTAAPDCRKGMLHARLPRSDRVRPSATSRVAETQTRDPDVGTLRTLQRPDAVPAPPLGAAWGAPGRRSRRRRHRRKPSQKTCLTRPQAIRFRPPPPRLPPPRLVASTIGQRRRFSLQREAARPASRASSPPTPVEVVAAWRSHRCPTQNGAAGGHGLMRSARRSR